MKRLICLLPYALSEALCWCLTAPFKLIKHLIQIEADLFLQSLFEFWIESLICWFQLSKCALYSVEVIWVWGYCNYLLLFLIRVFMSDIQPEHKLWIISCADNRILILEKKKSWALWFIFFKSFSSSESNTRKLLMETTDILVSWLYFWNYMCWAAIKFWASVFVINLCANLSCWGPLLVG